MNIRRKTRWSAVGTGARMEGTALGIWSLYSPSRLYIFRLLYNQRAEYVFVFLLYARLSFKRWLGLGTNDRHTSGVSTSISWTGSSRRFTRLKWFYEFRLLVLSKVVTATCGIRTIGSTLSLFSIPGYISLLEDFFALFRVFRGLPALKHVTFFADGIVWFLNFLLADLCIVNTLPIMAAVKKNVGPLQNVILLTFFLLVFYSLLGTQFLQNSMNQRCFRTADKQLAYPMRFCDKKAAGGYVCPPFQNCMTYENPNHGATTVDYL
ncbi:uncharacterized protein LOC112347591 isoform X2 [Selaginella moellendorffii]|nr:uncharacterized protein LOC112347591 isoform X2 [Selaginella moellendorffii]|eukprot:XP_024534448.1 uncharacterized protein LOC112347591 isoform X2 [Selaginella moellendorffii]